jgi:hypothetical protein
MPEEFSGKKQPSSLQSVPEGPVYEMRMAAYSGGFKGGLIGGIIGAVITMIVCLICHYVLGM